MSNQSSLGLCLAGIVLLLTACQTIEQELPPRDTQAAATCSCRNFAPPPETLKRIMAIDPEHVSDKDIREVLAETPAPRIINIHGGLLPLQGSMTSFSEFLVGMGYPRASIRNPRDGSYVFGYYVRSERICGLVAWYYEHEGLRPILVGHSQGGIQVIKVLHELAGESKEKVPVWNPMTWKAEERYDVIDPLTGISRPVTSLSVPYATAVVAGGLGRALPNQWEMNGKLRIIPDSVEDFTGFQKGMDMLGGDFFGYGAANDYQSCGKAHVRNVRLPASYSHSTIPSTRHLLKSQQIRDWINDYEPGQGDVAVEFDSSSTHILWAADVWHSIKKHWVLELQRLLTATRSDV